MTTRPLAVGDVIHGSAYGAFGRDHYHCVRIEAVGPDWIVARDPDAEWNGPSFTAGRRSLELCQQARDEGHRTEYGDPPQPCPLADTGPPPPSTATSVVLTIEPDPKRLTDILRNISRPPRA